MLLFIIMTLKEVLVIFFLLVSQSFFLIVFKKSFAHQTKFGFFHFLLSRCRIWVENCRRADLEAKTADQLNKHYRLCAKHFDPAMVCKTV